MNIDELKSIKINDLVLFTLDYEDEDLPPQTAIGYIQNIDTEKFQIGIFKDRVKLFWMPQFECLTFSREVPFREMGDERRQNHL